MGTARTHRRHGQRGQALLIFGLSALVLFAIIGLAVDAGVSYAESALEERAAAAAALHGVTFMPTFTGSAPNDATSQAIAIAAQNGFVQGGPQNVTVTAAQLPAGCGGATPCDRNRLHVTVGIDVATTFLHLVGFGTHRVVRDAVAEYLRPITLGQPGAQSGSDLAGLGTGGSNYYFMRTEGWGTDRGQGDAFTPNPTGSITGANSTGATPDQHVLSSLNGTESNDPVVSTLSQRGGYNYQVFVPAGVTATVQVFNPAFAPDPGCLANKTLTTCKQVGSTLYEYHERDGDFTLGSTTASDYSVMAYTLFTVPNVFGHGTDAAISKMTVLPIDANGVVKTPATWRDITRSSADITSAPPPDLYHNWLNVGAVDATDNPGRPLAKRLTTLTTYPAYTALTGAAGGGSYYRLRVDTLDSNGRDPYSTGSTSHAHKGYAVRAMSGGSVCATCTVSALNDLGIFTPVQSGGFKIPLMQIPPEYAGKTVSVDIYDPGDVGCPAAPTVCSNLLTILDNNGLVAQTADGGGGGSGVFKLNSSVNDASYVPVQITPPPPYGIRDASVQTEANGSATYNGKWLRYDIAVSPSYNPGPLPSSWYWSLQYTTNASAVDTVTVTLGFNGAPVHLING